MSRPHLPLNALRAFEASARHLSFTRAGLELRVTQAAVGHQVKALEAALGAPLFRRLPRGLALTDEGIALLPVLSDAFDRIGDAVARFGRAKVREVLTLGCVGTFATGWLFRNLDDFRGRHPDVELRVLTNNNRVDLAGDGLDLALRFGDGSWHGTEALHLCGAPLAPVCPAEMAERLATPADLCRETLLRSYRAEEWPLWFAMAGLPCPALHGPVFDSSVTMVGAAMQGLGVALVPVRMFAHEIAGGTLRRPFRIEVPAGSYWLTWLKSKPLSAGGRAFRDWLLDRLAADAGAGHRGAGEGDGAESA